MGPKTGQPRGQMRGFLRPCQSRRCSDRRKAERLVETDYRDVQGGAGAVSTQAGRSGEDPWPLACGSSRGRYRLLHRRSCEARAARKELWLDKGTQPPQQVLVLRRKPGQ